MQVTDCIAIGAADEKTRRSNLQPGRTGSYTVGEVAVPCRAVPCRTASKFSLTTRSSLPSLFSFFLLISHKFGYEEGWGGKSNSCRLKEAEEKRMRRKTPEQDLMTVFRRIRLAMPFFSQLSSKLRDLPPKGAKKRTRMARSLTYIR